MNWEQLGSLLWTGTVDTLYMTFWSSVIAYLIGLPLGVLLVVTRRDGIMPSPGFNSVLGVLINFLRSIPFIIMLAMLFPVTRAVMGTAIGTRSIIFPLVISAFASTELGARYDGDTILNSMSDTVFVLFGFVAALRLPLLVAVGLAALLELATAFAIGDSLLLSTFSLGRWIFAGTG